MSKRTGLQLPIDPQVVDLIARGYTDKQIAKQLDCSYNRVRWHVQQGMAKLNTTKRTNLVVKFYAAKEEASKEQEVPPRD